MYVLIMLLFVDSCGCSVIRGGCFWMCVDLHGCGLLFREFSGFPEHVISLFRCSDFDALKSPIQTQVRVRASGAVI